MDRGHNIPGAVHRKKNETTWVVVIRLFSPTSLPDGNTYASPLLPGFTALLPALHSGHVSGVNAGTVSITNDL
jgi:hypothetical protein